MIKIRLRKNLLYLFVYYIASIINCNIIRSSIFNLSHYYQLLIFDFLYPLENIIGGLVVFLYQKYSTRKKEKPKFFGIKLIQNKKNNVTDGKFKKIILIFFASYFNFYGSLISTKFSNDLSPWSLSSMKMRLSSIQIIISTLICIYALGFEIKRHHKISLIVMGIFMLLLFSTDIIYINLNNSGYLKSRNLRRAIFEYFLILHYYISYSFGDCIEKYLVDYNYMNPFIILMFEGIFEFLMTPIFLLPIGMFPHNAFTKIKKLGIFIFLFILYNLLQVIINIYRIYCNVIYSPMARSLIDYLLNPFINIVAFFLANDSFNNHAYLIIIEIECIVLSFFGCIFNEYIILYCCGLERETQDEIAVRANNQFQNELDDIKDTFRTNDIAENDDNIKKSDTIISLDGYGLGI